MENVLNELLAKGKVSLNLKVSLHLEDVQILNGKSNHALQDNEMQVWTYQGAHNLRKKKGLKPYTPQGKREHTGSRRGSPKKTYPKSKLRLQRKQFGISVPELQKLIKENEFTIYRVETNNPKAISPLRFKETKKKMRKTYRDIQSWIDSGKDVKSFLKSRNENIF